jgi:hypothetical protein
MESKPSPQQQQQLQMHPRTVSIEGNMAITAAAAAMKHILHLDNIQLPFFQNVSWEVPFVSCPTNDNLVIAEPIPLSEVDGDSVGDQIPLSFTALLAESLGAGKATDEAATAALAAAPKVSNPFEDGDCLRFEGKSFFFVADDYSQSEQYQPQSNSYSGLYGEDDDVPFGTLLNMF